MLYEDVELKKQTTEPVMLLMQKKIRQLEKPDTVLNETKKKVEGTAEKLSRTLSKESNKQTTP